MSGEGWWRDGMGDMRSSKLTLSEFGAGGGGKLACPKMTK
jgi:hypothetical protein